MMKELTILCLGVGGILMMLAVMIDDASNPETIKAPVYVLKTSTNDTIYLQQVYPVK